MLGDQYELEYLPLFDDIRGDSISDNGCGSKRPLARLSARPRGRSGWRTIIVRPAYAADTRTPPEATPYLKMTQRNKIAPLQSGLQFLQLIFIGGIV